MPGPFQLTPIQFVTKGKFVVDPLAQTTGYNSSYAENILAVIISYINLIAYHVNDLHLLATKSGEVYFSIENVPTIDLLATISKLETLNALADQELKLLSNRELSR